MKRIQFQILNETKSLGNLKKAANMLGKSPSNIGRAIRNLEEELGCSLIIYRNRQLSFTPEGNLVLAHSNNFLTIARQLDSYASMPGSYNWSDREILYLLTIRKTQSLSQAARELYVSQPALSQLISNIQGYFGKEIYSYLSKQNKLELTAFGEEILTFIEKMDGVINAIRKDLEEFYQLRRGTVRIGITNNIGMSLIPKIMPAFMKHFPEIKLRILENNSTELKKLLENQKIDFAILHEDSFPVWNEHIHYSYVRREPIYLVIPESYEARLALPKNRPLTASDLLGLASEKYVLVAKKTGLRSVIERIFLNVSTKTGVTYRPVAACSAKNRGIVKSLVEAEAGISFLPESDLYPVSENMKLTSYPLDDSLDASWMIALALPQAKRMSRCSMELISVVQESLMGL